MNEIKNEFDFYSFPLWLQAKICGLSYAQNDYY